MKEYVILTNIYDPVGGAYKYAQHPVKNPYKMVYTKKERQEFIDKWKYILKEDMYFDSPKVYFIDYENLKVLEITDKLEEIENSL